ncbi:MAG: FAD-dependent oxidoreductase [Bacteroidota bacterium]|nr:FAD-dependent oxidoreductase [Bacteroidota bacterium]
MQKYKYVIIGGGTTAGYAAKEFVRQGLGKKELCIISAERILPMDRPPLSKEFIRTEMSTDDILINDKKFYNNHGIDLLLNVTAESVNFEKKTVSLNKGSKIKYDKLLIASGTQLRYLSVNGHELKNIHYIRTARHAKEIRKAAQKANQILVIGSQYIGTEMAASLKQLDKNVTMVFPGGRLLSKFASQDISDYLMEYYLNKGIKIISHDEVVQFNGDKKVEEVELRSDKIIKADMVVAGIGVRPNISAVKKTNIALNDGILVNESLETNIPDVYAAGDVARFPDKIFDKMRRVEHWENAFEQGKLAARVMSGKKETYDFLPFFFSDIFDISYEYYGDNESADAVFNRGKVSSGDFSTWWFRNDVPVAAFIMSSRPEEEGKKAREWISNKSILDAEKIENEEIKLDNIIKNKG